MDISLKEEINLYISSKLTPTELFVIRLLFLAIDGDPQYLIDYLSNVSNGKELFRQILSSLKEKKVINATFKVPKEGETLNYKNIPFNKNFLKRYLKEANVAGKQLFDAYPSFININGKMCSIKNITKANLYSLEDFCLYYSKAIKSSKVKHEEVMEALEYGKENNLISYSITEFIASRKWNEINEIRNSGDINGYQNSELL